MAATGPRRICGVTLAELVVVLLMIVLLAGVSMPGFIHNGLRSNESALRADLRRYRNAVLLFSLDNNAWPERLDDLASACPPSAGIDSAGAPRQINPGNWHGPYVDSIVSDPVSKQPFEYSTSPPTVGKVESSAIGRSTDGSRYASW